MATPVTYYGEKSASPIAGLDYEGRSDKEGKHNAMLVEDLKRLLGVEHRNEVFRKVKQMISVNKSTNKSISLFQRLKKLMNDCYNEDPLTPDKRPLTSANYYRDDDEMRDYSNHKSSKSHHKRAGVVAREFSHKEVWRWIRKIITEYSQLKLENTEGKGGSHWKQLVDILLDITRAPSQKFLIPTVERLSEEHMRQGAVMRKLKE